MKTVAQRNDAAEAVFEELRTFCMALPGTGEKTSWGHPNFYVGSTTYVTFENIKGRPSVVLLLDAETLAKYAKRNDCFSAQYGKGKWIGMWVDREFDWNELCGLVKKCHAFAASKPIKPARKKR